MFNKPKRFSYHVVTMFEDNIFKNSCHFMRELLLVFWNCCLKFLSLNNIQIIEFLLDCDENFIHRLPNITNAAGLNENKIKTF